MKIKLLYRFNSYIELFVDFFISDKKDVYDAFHMLLDTDKDIDVPNGTHMLYNTMLLFFE